jgi:hypothetical protein
MLNSLRSGPWGALIFALGATVWILAHSPSFTECATYPNQKQHNQTLEEGVSRLPSFTRVQECLTGFLETNKDFLMLLATVTIAWFTGTLWRSTEKLWLVSKQAADAATLSAKAAIGIELPIIRALSPKLIDVGAPIPDHGPYAGGIVEEAAPNKYAVIGHVIFRNDGRTPAFPLQLAIGHRVAQELPTKPAFTCTETIAPGKILPIQGEEVWIDARYQMEFSAGEIAAIKSETTRLWLYCSLTYSDFLTERHEVHFCWLWGRPDKTGIFYFTSQCDPPPAYRQKS